MVVGFKGSVSFGSEEKVRDVAIRDMAEVATESFSHSWKSIHGKRKFIRLCEIVDNSIDFWFRWTCSLIRRLSKLGELVNSLINLLWGFLYIETDFCQGPDRRGAVSINPS